MSFSLSKETIKKYFNLPALSLNTANFNEKMKRDPIALEYKVVDENSLIGIEVEVEGLEDGPPPPSSINPFWKWTEDGSLRNYGFEFISHPIRGNQIEYALRQLFEVLPEDRDFSPRTSVHVHLNVRTLSSKELHGLMKLVVLFEPLLFSFVGAERDKNIHCVPIRGSTLVEDFSIYFPDSPDKLKWAKYSSFNYLPVSKYGTVEFRHMHGTDDVNKLMIWINAILSLKRYVLDNDPQTVDNNIFALNSNSQYVQFACDVFGDYAHELPIHHPLYKNWIEEGVEMLKTEAGAKILESEMRGTPTNPKFLVKKDKKEFIDMTPAPQVQAPQGWFHVTDTLTGGN